MYWRGALAQCLSQEERALEDLQTFVEVRGESTLWAGLVDDAKKRIRRLSKRAGGSMGSAPAPGLAPGISVGAGLAVASVALGIGAAVQWQAALAHAEGLYPQKLTGTDFETAFAEGEDLANTSAGLTGLSIGCGVGSALAFAITALSSPPSQTALLQPPVLLPIRGGTAVLWEGRW